MMKRSSIKAIFYYFSLFVVVITSCNVFAVEQKSTSPVNEDESFFSVFDTPHSYISSNVESLVRDLDEYFSSDKVRYEKSGTLLRLRGDVIWAESNGVKVKSDIRLKLQLPLTQKKMSLVFQSKVAERNFDGSSEERDTAYVEVERGEEYTAEIQTSLGEKSSWQFKPSIGAYLTSSIDTYVKFRFNHQQSFDKWSINWDETPYWVDSIGWAFDSYFEINRKIGEHDLFRSATYAGWRNDNDYFELSQFFSINYRLDEKSAVSYFSGVYGLDDPKIHTTQYLLGVNYRRNLHKNYLFLEVKPEVKYLEINRFRPEHSIILRFEMLFQK